MGGTEEDEFRGQVARMMQQTQQSLVKACHPVLRAHCRCPIQVWQQSAGALGLKDQGALRHG
jgi:hypothetical protein